MKTIALPVPTNDFIMFKEILMNFEYEDLNDEDLVDLRNMLSNLMYDCESTMRNRGLNDK